MSSGAVPGTSAPQLRQLGVDAVAINVVMTTLDIAIHPLALALPAMSDAEYNSLLKSIRERGLDVPLVTYQGMVLDGRHRLRACASLNIKPTFIGSNATSDEEAEAHMLALNVHRRHLTAEQRRKIVAAELKADPSRSDRVIAEKAQVSHVTVAAARRLAERTGQIDQLSKTIGADGKARGVKPRSVPRVDSPELQQERLERMRALADSGHSALQIAEAIGLHPETVGRLLKSVGAKVRVANRVASHVNAEKIIAETIDIFATASSGIEMARASGLTMSRERATQLLADLRPALKQIRWMERSLKEIANG